MEKQTICYLKLTQQEVLKIIKANIKGLPKEFNYYFANLNSDEIEAGIPQLTIQWKE